MITRIQTPSAINAYLQYPLEGTGVRADPFDWYTVDTVVEAVSTVTVVEGNEYDSIEKYYNIKLTASQLYTFSISGVDAMSTTVTIYYGGSQVAQGVFDQMEWTWSLSYTPSATGTYLIKVSTYSYGVGGTLSTTPVPTEITPWIEKASGVYASTGFDDLGYIICTRSAIAAGLVDGPLSAPNNLTANDSNPNWLVSASSLYDVGTSPYLAFNGSDGTDSGGVINRWMTSGDESGWISWRSLNKKILVRSYSLNASPEVGYEARSPRNWTLEGSNDGNTWAVIHTVTNGFGPNAPTTYQLTNHTVPLGNSKYFYHRLNITATYSGGGYLSIGQIQAWRK